MTDSTPYLLTLDLGTTNCKCTLFDAMARIVAQGSASYPEVYPRPGWVEQDPEAWWLAIGNSTRQALEAAGVEPASIAAIGVTGQMHGILAVDATGQALTPCLTLRDGRATAEAEQITAQLGLEEVYRITGGRLAPSLPVAKIRWLRQQRPEIYARTQAFLPPKDYLRLRLTGEFATEAIDAAGMLLFDVQAGDWSAVMADVANVSLDKLPLVRAPWDVAGKLTDGAAGHLGLLAGTPVVVGAGDDIEFLGYGIFEPGAALEHVGTTGSIMACVDRLAADPAMAVEVYPHVEPDLWLVGGSVNSAGGAIDWTLRMLGSGDGSTQDAVLGAATEDLPAGDRPLLFLPYLAGERCPIWDPAAKGAWFGLTLAHQPADLLRAALEGVGFALRHVLETIENLAVPVPWLAVQAPLEGADWLAMRANIYGRPLRLVGSIDATALGTLIVTGIGAGLYDSPAAGVAATRGAEVSINPDPEAAGRYDRLYALYKDLSTACRPLFSHFGNG